MSAKNRKYLLTFLIILVIIFGVFSIFHKTKTTKSTLNIAPTYSVNSTVHSPDRAIKNTVLETNLNPAVGQYLSDPSGNTLYTYGGDSADVSNCTSECLISWAAYLDTDTSNDLPNFVSTIKRTDNGEVQFTYKGRPLYHFAYDTKGLITGNNIDDFHVAKP